MRVPDPRRARIFGSFAEDYHRWRPGYPAEAVAWLVPPGASVVADVGAGTGKLTGVLLERGLAVLAVEPDPGMLAVLTRENPTASAHLGAAEALPLPDASVDAVLVGQAWHWFGHERALAEAHRVVRPGGWLGLLSNQATAREPWEYELEAMALDPVDRAVDRPGGWEPDGLPLGALEFARFPADREVTAASLRATVATFSQYALLAEAERDARLDAIAAVVAAEADRRGAVKLRLHQVTHCARLRLTP